MQKIPPWLWLLGGVVLILTFAVGGPVAVNYISAAWMSSQNAQKWAPVLATAESSYGIPGGLLARIAFQESSFEQDIIDGTRPSSAGALGMMQLMPGFFFSVQRPVPFTDQDTSDQIQEAAQFLAGLYNHFGNWTAAVAAYNDGQTNIEHVLAGTKALPTQTANYLKKISADLPDIISPTLNA